MTPSCINICSRHVAGVRGLCHLRMRPATTQHPTSDTLDGDTTQTFMLQPCSPRLSLRHQPRLMSHSHSHSPATTQHPTSDTLDGGATQTFMLQPCSLRHQPRLMSHSHSPTTTQHPTSDTLDGGATQPLGSNLQCKQAAASPAPSALHVRCTITAPRDRFSYRAATHERPEGTLHRRSGCMQAPLMPQRGHSLPC